MKTVDAMGKVCPVPVIETKKVLRSEEGKDGVLVLVDNEIATQNLSKMAKQMKLESSVKKVSDHSYEVTIGGVGDGNNACQIMDFEENAIDTSNYVVAIGSDKMGEGAEELGHKLIGSFIYSLTEQDVLPKTILFYNSGVKLVVEGSASLEDLKALKDKGVEIYACGLCLNYYGITEQLKVGEVTNMYRILEIMRENYTVKP